MVFELNNTLGKKKEFSNKDYLESIYGKLIHHHNDRYAPFDFENDLYKIEFKSRNNMKHDSFKEIMMTTQKRVHAKKEKMKTVLWIFQYDDGIYQINYHENKEYLDNLPVIQTNTKFGLRNNLHIPNNLLVKI